MRTQNESLSLAYHQRVIERALAPSNQIADVRRLIISERCERNIFRASDKFTIPLNIREKHVCVHMKDRGGRSSNGATAPKKIKQLVCVCVCLWVLFWWAVVRNRRRRRDVAISFRLSLRRICIQPPPIRDSWKSKEQRRCTFYIYSRFLTEN